MGGGSIAVVGAGLAGLVVAHRLRAAGVEVEVFEAAARPGGLLETSAVDGFVREHAASSFLAGAPAGVAALCAELGVAIEPASGRAARRWIYVDGALRALPRGPRELVASDLLGASGKLRLLLEPFARRAPTDREETVAELLARRLGAQALRRVGAPFVTGVFAADPTELSAAAAFPTLAALDADGGFVVGGLKRAWRSRRSGAGRGVRPPRGLAAPVGGVGRVVDVLASRLGGALRLGTPVVAVGPDPAVDAADPTPAAIRLTVGDGRGGRFAGCVLAVPPRLAAPLVAGASPALAAELAGLVAAPAACVHLGFRRAELAHPLGGFGFLVAAGEPLRLLGCVFESELWTGRAPDGAGLVRCIFGGARDPSALDQGDAALIAQARADLDRALGGFPTPLHASVTRSHDALAQYRVGHAARVARAEVLATPLALELCGAAYRGVGLNAIAADAGRVADRIARRLGRLGPALALVALAAAGAAACSCGGSPPTRSDGGAGAARAIEVASRSGGDEGAEAGEGGRPSAAPDAGPPPVPGATTGDAEVAVEWLRPPSALLAEPGLTRCGTPARAALRAAGLGGVAGAFVFVEPPAPPAVSAAPPADEPTLAIDACRLEPPALQVAPGAAVAIANRDPGRHAVSIAAIDERGATTPIAAFDLALIGQRRAVVLDRPGVYRAEVDGGSPSWILVAPPGAAAVTTDVGAASFAGLAPGAHAIRVWHPPVAAGEPPLELRAEVEVVAGRAVRRALSLADGRKRAGVDPAGGRSSPRVDSAGGP